MLLTLLTALALGGDPVVSYDALSADLDKWDAALTTHGKYPFGWSDSEKKRLSDGVVVKRREKRAGADRVLGAIWTSVPLNELWVAVQDEWHWGHVDGLVEERLPGSTFQDKILFQSIDLPWPFKDRQWVIRVVNNLELYGATDKRAIERTWDLVDRRDAKNVLADGVWVGVNEGGWFASEAAGGSLLVYHVRAVVGGNVPDDAASQWTMLTLGGMMRGLAERSLEMQGHYVGEHPRVRWPDGVEVAPFAE